MRNATCAVCGTRIDVDETRQCPTCEAVRERVRGYRPQLRTSGGAGAAVLRGVGWFVGLVVLVAVAFVVLRVVRG